VDASPSFPSSPQASEAVKPGEGSLDHPVVGPQANVLKKPDAPGDRTHDASAANLLSVDVVVTAVGEQPPGRPTRPQTAGRASCRHDWGTSLRYRPASRAANRVPVGHQTSDRPFGTPVARRFLGLSTGLGTSQRAKSLMVRAGSTSPTPVEPCARRPAVPQNRQHRSTNPFCGKAPLGLPGGSGPLRVIHAWFLDQQDGPAR
jgi:hypothetical protein